jgi:hypothetical protein
MAGFDGGRHVQAGIRSLREEQLTKSPAKLRF